MQGRRHSELIGVGFIVESAIEVVSITREARVRNSEDHALEIGFVAVGAVEDSGVEDVFDVCGGSGGDAGKLEGDVAVESGFGGDAGV